MTSENFKKNRELEILKKVFGNSISYEEKEQPDFILKYSNGIKYGVEITEIYYDQTSARLKKDGYIEQLINEKKYLHKEDKKKLHVHEGTFFSRDKKYKPTTVPILFFPKYTERHFMKSLQRTINAKEEKLCEYSTDVINHCMLIIYDCENQYKGVNESEVAKMLFTNELAQNIRKSKFYEIYLVTMIDGSERYIPLKAYLLVSDCHLFFEYIRENGLWQKLIEKCSHPFFGFAEVLLRRGCKKVLVGQVENGKVVENIVIYIEKYGLGMTVHPDDNWGVGIFDYYPLKEIGATAELVIGDESDFFDDELFIKYEEAVKNKITSIGLNFQTPKL